MLIAQDVVHFSHFQYFHGIVGFFVCEDHILNTGGGLVSKGYLEEVICKLILRDALFCFLVGVIDQFAFCRWGEEPQRKLWPP